MRSNVQLARTRHGFSTCSFFAVTSVLHHVAAPGDGRAPDFENLPSGSQQRPAQLQKLLHIGVRFRLGVNAQQCSTGTDAAWFFDVFIFCGNTGVSSRCCGWDSRAPDFENLPSGPQQRPAQLQKLLHIGV
jgi:hypothetical protein